MRRKADGAPSHEPGTGQAGWQGIDDRRLGGGAVPCHAFFGQWEDSQRNPNAQVQSTHGEGFIEVRLLGNGQGHFVMDGAINGQVVHFMLDTGATDVAIPRRWAASWAWSVAARCSSVPPTAVPKATARA